MNREEEGEDDEEEGEGEDDDEEEDEDEDDLPERITKTVCFQNNSHRNIRSHMLRPTFSTHFMQTLLLVNSR